MEDSQADRQFYKSSLELSEHVRENNRNIIGKLAEKHTMNPKSLNSTEDIDTENPIKKSFIWKCIDEYFDNTSLHGMKYVTQETYHFLERFSWLIICLVGWYYSVQMVIPIVNRYQETAMTTTIKSTNVPIYEAKFPGVTICNVNKADKELLRYEAENISPDRSEYYLEKLSSLLAQLSPDFNYKIDDEELSKLEETLFKWDNDYFVSMMKYIMQPIDRMGLRCWWIGKEVNCRDIFKFSSTDEGYCWTFNGYDIIDTSIIRLYDETDSEENYTLKQVNAAGSNMGLSILLNPDCARYVSHSREFCGFKVLVHNPYDFPTIEMNSFVIEPGSEVFAAVTVNQMSSSDTVNELSFEKRKCCKNFVNEFPLRLFKFYQYSNCLQQCLIYAMNKTCNCIPYMYSAFANGLFKNCHYEGLKCIQENKKNISSIAPNILKVVNVTSGNPEECDCPENCVYTKYITELSVADNFPKNHKYISLGSNPIDTADITRTDLILLRVFFNKLYFVRYERDLVYTWESFVAAFGGLVSLFVGFSLIGGVEIIYFCTFRPFFRWMKDRKSCNQQKNISESTNE